MNRKKLIHLLNQVENLESLLHQIAVDAKAAKHSTPGFAKNAFAGLMVVVRSLRDYDGLISRLGLDPTPKTISIEVARAAERFALMYPQKQVNEPLNKIIDHSIRLQTLLDNKDLTR